MNKSQKKNDEYSTSSKLCLKVNKSKYSIQNRNLKALFGIQIKLSQMYQNKFIKNNAEITLRKSREILIKGDFTQYSEKTWLGLCYDGRVIVQL